jgi:D-alanyl-lipoteichoic acid acyltransferase DltB (MBOAT superfamily)
MPFHSYGFILLFLPLALAGFHLLLRLRAPRAALGFVTLASLALYATWDVRYVALVVPLMVADLAVAHGMRASAARRPGIARGLLLAGLAINLGALAYCKYAGFFVENLERLTDFDVILRTVVLPIGISFLTFQKIAFLVDVYRGDVEDLDWLRYAGFVLFFPKLLSGPIAYHGELAPQLATLAQPAARNVTAGITLFTFGLAKKVLVADWVAGYASPLFDAAAQGAPLDLAASWGAVLSYGAEIYFDFSGYTDMALGAALLFGIRLPVNFDAPYRASDIADFWRRWHMTLSRFLREYLFVPLSFGTHWLGAASIPFSLLVTMLICGLWHGPRWTFVIWGALHGAYLVVHYVWNRSRRGVRREADVARSPFGPVLTFVAVTVAWAFFRAADVPTALAILKGMAGLNGAAGSLTQSDGALFAAFGALLLAWFGPTTQRIVSYEGPEQSRPAAEARAWIAWTPSPAWAISVGCLFAVCVMRLSRVTEFIYFRF